MAQQITFKIDGVDYEYDGRLTFKEGLEIERITGHTIAEWERGLSGGSLLDLGAMVFIVRKRTNPDLRFSDLDFTLSEFDIETEEDESPEGEGRDDAA